MVSNTDGNKKPNSSADWKKNKLKTGKVHFKGAATSDSVLHQKVVTNDKNQAGQLLALVTALFRYVGEKQMAGWAESLREMERKEQADFTPARVLRGNYGVPGANAGDAFVWNAPADETEERYDTDFVVWKADREAGMKRFRDYENNGEYIMLAIEGQIESSLWDKTKADVRFAAIQTAKCPIALIKLMKLRATGTQSGVWGPLAFMMHLGKNLSHYQVFNNNVQSIGQFKREVEAQVATTVQLGGKLAYGSKLMEPFLTDAGQTLATYFAMTPVQQRPYEVLYEDMVVTIIMIKNCGYESLRKWLSQQHMGPNAQAYPTVSNELVDMMNSDVFEADKPKSGGKKNKYKNKDKDKDKNKEGETVGAIVEQAEEDTDTSSSDPESSDDDHTNTNDEDATSEDIDNEEESDDNYSTYDDDEQEDMRRVFAMINANDDSGYDPQEEDDVVYADFEEAMNNSEIVGCVTTERTYEEDDYDHIPHTHKKFDEVREGWSPEGGPMPHEKAELENPFFTGSECRSIVYGFNMDPNKVHPEVAREIARRPTSNAPSHLTKENIGVVVRRVGVLLNKHEDYVQPVLDTLDQMGIRSCETLDAQLYRTLHNRHETERFTTWFEGVSHDLRLSFIDLQYLRCCSMYMNVRWKHDHEYFQRMIEWEQREAGRQEIIPRGTNENEVVGALITNMHEFLKDEVSSDDDSMPGLQDRARSDSSSSDGSSMPFLQSRAAEDSSSDDDTMSCDEDGLYNDGEHCVYKARTLKEIIGTDFRGIEEKGGRLGNISLALFKYNLMGTAQFSHKPSPSQKQDFRCARE